MQTKMKLATLVAIVALAGCTSEADKARLANLQVNPEVTVVSEIDGCVIKFVNRGYENNSFYLAKCDNTQTTTRNYHVQSGKTQVFRRSTTIEQDIQTLQAEKRAAEVQEKALSKLTDEERKALGVK